MKMTKTVLLGALLLLVSLPCERGFYIPGVAPVEFHAGESIAVKGVKLTSMKTALPYEYYSVAFCKPPGGEIQYKSENLGEILRGDRIVNTPFKVAMKEDLECASLCQGTDPVQLGAKETETLLRRIREEYHVHLLIDNLPAATRLQLPGADEAYYDHGYKLGYVAEDGKAYVNNHLELRLKFHQHAEGEYRVVGFEVRASSVAWDSMSVDSAGACSPKGGDMGKLPPQELVEGAENRLRWTYSVVWEESDLRWASRWDTYLAMRDVQIHWFSIVNSMVVVACLSGFLAIIIVRTVRRDIAAYNQDEEQDEALEETGWKLVHGDVFRPPPLAKQLVVLVGSGLQLAGVGLVTLFFAMLGMLSPSSRGSLMSVALFLYCFMGLIAGYYAGRLYKTLRGAAWKKAALQTATFFPGVVLGTGFFLNFFIWGKASSGAVPFGTMVALAAMWLGIDLPLVFLGFYFGFRKQAYPHPVRTNQIPRQVPEQPWYLSLLPCLGLAGVLPFGAMFIELFFIFSAIWENQFYYLFGFLFLVYLILAVSSAQIAIVVTYFQLCAENYHWWWRSFAVAGASAFYVFAYAIFYFFTKLDLVGFIPSLLYFSYSALFSLTAFLATGALGFYAAYAFNTNIYAAVKID